MIALGAMMIAQSVAKAAMDRRAVRRKSAAASDPCARGACGVLSFMALTAAVAALAAPIA